MAAMAGRSGSVARRIRQMGGAIFGCPGDRANTMDAFAEGCNVPRVKPSRPEPALPIWRRAAGLLAALRQVYADPRNFVPGRSAHAQGRASMREFRTMALAVAALLTAGP